MARSKHKHIARRIAKAAMVLGGMLAVIAAARFWYLEEQGNFHPITPGEAYRSAQLDPDEQAYYIRKFNIRSVINLRGSNAGERWYDEEIDTSRKLGVNHYDLGLSADIKPTFLEIRSLLKLLEIAPRPVLIHCLGGADRSGLAAAIWQVAIKGLPKADARRQLSFIYGHMSFGPTQVLDQFFEQWVLQKIGKNAEKITG
jgi:protein tyrosine/serine phosphatase